MSKTKTVLLLGREDHTEAMRVAAGLTIFGHTVRLVFMTGPIAETEENAEQAELLELSDIIPETTVAGQDIAHLDAAALSMAMLEADAVICL
jgi:lipopolysaccharide biosynthesis protein